MIYKVFFYNRYHPTILRIISNFSHSKEREKISCIIAVVDFEVSFFFSFYLFPIIKKERRKGEKKKGEINLQ